MNVGGVDELLARAGLGPLERHAWLEVDLDVLAQNATVLSSLAKDVALGVVVKADGYGHGMEMVARAAVAGGAKFLIVATIGEAVRLRSDGCSNEIFVLYPIPTAHAGAASRNHIDVTVGSRDDVSRLGATGAALSVHLEVDTGMTRGGVEPAEAIDVARDIIDTPNLRLAGVWSHLLDPEADTTVARQVAVFDSVTDALTKRGIEVPLRHLHASGGLLAWDTPKFDMVRVGLMFFGLSPLSTGRLPTGIAPAASLKARPIHLAHIDAGDTVGYGGDWVARSPSVIATLPFGYADGWSRSSVPGASAMVGGVVVPIVGRISSDATTIDVTSVPVDPEDEIAVLGADASISAEAVAKARDTITWEVLQQMSPRLTRVYISAGQVVAIRRESAVCVEWAGATNRFSEYISSATSEEHS